MPLAVHPAAAKMAPMLLRLLVPFVFAANAVGQQDPVAPLPPTPEQQLQSKLAQPFLTRVDWITDYDLARERAAARRQLIFGYFTTAGY